MAKFTIELVEMKVGKDAKGHLAKFRGKTLTECVQFMPSLSGGFETSMLREANEKFSYVADKLENGKVHKAYRTSKIAKWAKENLTGKVVSMEDDFDADLEKAKAMVAKANAERKAAQEQQREQKKQEFLQVASNEPSIEDAMAEAEALNAKMDLISKVKRSNLPQDAKQQVLALIG